MVRLSKKRVSKKVFTIMSDQLISGVLRAGSKEESAQFLRELHGPEERIMLAKRLSIVALLHKGYGTRSIGAILKVSTATVNRVLKEKEAGRYAFLETLITKGKTKGPFQEFLSELEELITVSLVYSPKAQWRFRNKMFRKMDVKEARAAQERHLRQKTQKQL